MKEPPLSDTQPRITVEAKAWYKSWTLWGNLLAFLVVCVDWAIAQDFAIVREGWFLAGVTVLNMVVRVVKTKRPIAASTKMVTIHRFSTKV